MKAPSIGSGSRNSKSCAKRSIAGQAACIGLAEARASISDAYRLYSSAISKSLTRTSGSETWLATSGGVLVQLAQLPQFVAGFRNFPRRRVSRINRLRGARGRFERVVTTLGIDL
jgi:hypothetical protein